MTRWNVDRAIAALAAQQEGKFARRQVHEAGGDDHLILRHLEAGTWVEEAVATYGFPSARTTYRGRLWVSHLAIGPMSIISHEAAAQLRHLTGFAKGKVTLSIPHGAHPRVTGARIYQPKDLELHEGTLLWGLPVMTVPWIFVDMAGASRGRTVRLAVALNEAVTADQTSYEEVGLCLRRVAKRGKPGVTTLTQVLDAAGPGRIPSATQLERELDDLIERYDLPVPRRQYPHPGRQFLTGCVDRAYLNVKLILEADSRRWHTRIQDIKRDRERDNDAARAGFQTLRLLREHILTDPDGTAATIREVYAVRRTQLEAMTVENRQLLPPER